ncbi:MAG: carboxypeptidase-like regulatory domain-containing protein [Bacteroidales bacterium]|nr:carboxypeptidase-like regulatory domain-containing protein [Bacteroidales bacterium]MDT8372440.1 carboxypeptidase-like regulatory domain-containing protein [Bacteroidales bacterium]
MKIKPDLKIVLAILLLALVIFPVMAQERQVTGTVYEPDGVTPVFGATVVIKGTATGTSTDARGAYSIRVTGDNPVL